MLIAISSLVQVYGSEFVHRRSRGWLQQDCIRWSENTKIRPVQGLRNSDAKPGLSNGDQGIEPDGNVKEGERLGGKSLEARLLQRVSQTIAERQLLQPNEKILVAVSGGQDSICLLHILKSLESKWGWKLGVVHCDHQWSASARSQASHVAQIARSLKLDYYQTLTTRSVSGEGVARNWRYGVLQRIALRHGYEAIVTAHTCNDRVETLLYNLFRGSGLTGLGSIIWKRSLSPVLCLSHQSAFEPEGVVGQVEEPSGGRTAAQELNVALVRPLLNVTRTELNDLMQLLKLPLWPDPSNLSLDIGRNRIRIQLLSYLRKHFNPGIDKSLARWAEILHSEDVFLDGLCQTIRLKAESSLLGCDNKEIGRMLNFSVVGSVPMALQRRIIKQFIDDFTRSSTGFDIVERVRLAFSMGSGSRKKLQISLRGNFILDLLRNELRISKRQILHQNRGTGNFASTGN